MKKIAVFVGALSLALMGVVTTPGVTTAANTNWRIDRSALPFDPLPGFEDSTEQLWGVYRGASYLMEVPDDWNGDVVMYTHGYRGEGRDLTVDPPPIREYLLGEGFAWAASSYRANGYVPGTGAEDTHKLLRLFKAKVGAPDRVFLTGFSMGGHVIGAAIERYPNSFDGAVPMCGVMADNELFDYFQDAYLTAEYFAFGEVEVPTPDDYFTSPDGYQATFAALGDFFPVVLNEQGEKYKATIEQLSGGDRPTFDEGFADIGGVGAAFVFFFESATTGDGRENATTEYQLDSDPALDAEEVALNEAIPRIERPKMFEPRGRRGHIKGTKVTSPTITGDIPVPVLSIHTLGELFVPFHMEQIYAERVASHGKADLLVTRAIRDITHCGFTLDEQISAFADMVEWVDTGVRPAGDTVLDPAIVAADDFGCQFTTVDRPGLEPCAGDGE